MPKTPANSAPAQPDSPSPKVDGAPSVDTLPAQYKPAEHEGRVRGAWESSGAFHADPSRVLSGEREPFCVLIPPPNVTAALHLGHAFNNTLQDVLVRAHRMMGFETLWMPGTDHAGIATQAVVERRLRESGELKGPLRDSMTREAFVERAQAWKDEYEAKILGQLKAMGCSCDWERTRFTMDPICARAVREAFFQLFKAGLIYRGKRLVNWDPVLQTAVADDELEMREVEGKFYYLRYPLVVETEATKGRSDGATKGDGKPAAQRADWRPVTWSELAARGYPGARKLPEDQPAWVTVATTRPETYLGDTAVAVNPKDPRAVSLRGLMIELPVVGRVIPIIEDDYVVMADPEGSDPKAKFATGFLKVTPAHDENDYALYQRHKAVMDAAAGGDGKALINVMGPDAAISDKHGWTDVGDAHLFVGLSREKAREKVLAEFQSHAIGSETLLEAIKPYTHTLPYSDRSKVPIEPWLSDQWYVKVTDDRLRGEAQRALAREQRTTATFPAQEGVEGDGEMRFFPERYAKSYESWHDNLRDWCVSRQLWWGHRIPVWEFYKPHENNQVVEQAFFEFLQSAGEPSAHSIQHVGPEAFICARTEAAESALRWLDEYLRVTGLCELHPHWKPADVAAKWFDPNGYDSARSAAVTLSRFVRNFHRDADVLDTWFSSGVWPVSTLGWPEPEQSDQTRDTLAAFNPSTVLCTGRDIITLWVSRMVMFNRFLRAGTPPFKDVYINPIIQDGHGQRMSKSLGNGVDPLDIVHSHGADAMRFVLTQIATGTQDVRMPVDLVCPHTGKTFEPKFITSPQGYQVAAPTQDCPGEPSKKMVTPYGVASGKALPTAEMPLARTTSSKFDLGRNFCNKLWNASRFALGILGKAGAIGSLEGDGGSAADTGRRPVPPQDTGRRPVLPPELALIDRWMLSRVQQTTEGVTRAIQTYQFSTYAQLMYDLMWRDFCDWYLEAIKPTVATSRSQQAVLAHTLESIVRLLHPLIPFITEAIWERLRHIQTSPITGVALGASRVGGLLCSAGWPELNASLRDERAEATVARLQALSGAIREVRSKHQVPPKRRIVLHASPALAAEIAQGGGIVEALCVLSRVESAAPAGAAVTFAFDTEELRLSDLADAVDTGTERERLTKLIADLRKSIAALDGRLSNPGYADRAPPALVQQTRDEKARKEGELAAALASLARLG